MQQRRKLGKRRSNESTARAVDTRQIWAFHRSDRLCKSFWRPSRTWPNCNVDAMHSSEPCI